MRSGGLSSCGWSRSLSRSPLELAQAQKSPRSLFSSRRERVSTLADGGGGAVNWGLRALRILSAAVLPRPSSRTLVSLRWDEETEFFPGKGDAVFVVVTGETPACSLTINRVSARDVHRYEISYRAFRNRSLCS